ncbi:MAG: Fe-S cluster assembly protein SufD [Bacteroidetes bacterium]|jgi:Fe-S cluster assembly protein SufD|nr:Fe-S cluster assembly protein SufD [Bacteroidota bacterium]
MEKDTLQQTLPLDDMLIGQYRQYKDLISKNDTAHVRQLRENAFKKFEKERFPTSNDEQWRHTDVEALTGDSYINELQPPDLEKNIEEMFRCDVHNFDTESYSMLNGWHSGSGESLKTLPEGIVIGSIRAAMGTYPEIFEKHYGQIAESEGNGFIQINTAMMQDGVFIWVPDGVKSAKTLQIIKIINKEEQLFVQSRNLIVLGKNSELSLMHCDDSVDQHASLVNTVTEIFVDEAAHLEMYKLQNLNDQSALINSTFVRQLANSTIKTNTLTFNCGLIRNNIHVRLDGQGSHADVLGLYLMDKEQHIDNQIRIDHNVANCTSNELFKGILDEAASAVFNGYIYVARDAQKTNAYQNNNNILLTPTATINTMPFLEIYADDVKCSHGATVGQLDQEAMFYIRSRGISAANARLLLMYAFAADIINQISIEPLRQRIDDMVKKRLRGELSVCEKCVLHCGAPEKEYHFDIDLSQL